MSAAFLDRQHTLAVPWDSFLNPLKEFWRAGYAPRAPAVKSLEAGLMGKCGEAM